MVDQGWGPTPRQHLVRPELGPEMVVPEAERWRGTAVLAMAINVVAELLPVDLMTWSTWRAGIDLDPLEVARVRRHRQEGSSLGRAKLDVARELPIRDRVAYLAALAWPSSAHLASRSLRRRDALTSLAKLIRPLSS